MHHLRSNDNNKPAGSATAFSPAGGVRIVKQSQYQRRIALRIVPVGAPMVQMEVLDSGGGPSPRLGIGKDTLLHMTTSTNASWRDFLRSREKNRTRTKQELLLDNEFLKGQKDDFAFNLREENLRSNAVMSKLYSSKSNYDQIHQMLSAEKKDAMQSLMGTEAVTLPDDNDLGHEMTLSDNLLDDLDPTGSANRTPTGSPRLSPRNLTEAEARLLGVYLAPPEKKYKCTSPAHELTALFNALDANNLIIVDTMPSMGVQSLFECKVTPLSSSNLMRKTELPFTSVVQKNPKLTYTSQAFTIKKNILDSILKGNFDINHVVAMHCALEWNKRELKITRELLARRENDILRQKALTTSLMRKQDRAEIGSQNVQNQIVHFLESVRAAMIAVDHETAAKLDKRKLDLESYMHSFDPHDLGGLDDDDPLTITKRLYGGDSNSDRDRYVRVIVELEGLIQRARKGTIHETGFAQSSWFHKNLLAKLNAKVDAARRKEDWQRKQEKMEEMIMEGQDCLSAVDQVFTLGDNVTLRIAHILRMLDSDQRAQIVGAAGDALLLDPLLSAPCIDFQCPSCGLQFDPSKPDSYYAESGRQKMGRSRQRTREKERPETKDRTDIPSSLANRRPKYRDDNPKSHDGDLRYTDSDKESEEEYVPSSRSGSVTGTPRAQSRGRAVLESKISDLEATLAASVEELRKAEKEATKLRENVILLNASRDELEVKVREVEASLNQWTNAMAIPYRQLMMLYPEEEHPYVAEMVRRAVGIEKELEKYIKGRSVKDAGIQVLVDDSTSAYAVAQMLRMKAASREKNPSLPEVDEDDANKEQDSDMNNTLRMVGSIYRPKVRNITPLDGDASSPRAGGMQGSPRTRLLRNSEEQEKEIREEQEAIRQYVSKRCVQEKLSELDQVDIMKIIQDGQDISKTRWKELFKNIPKLKRKPQSRQCDAGEASQGAVTLSPTSVARQQFLAIQSPVTELGSMMRSGSPGGLGRSIITKLFGANSPSSPSGDTLAGPVPRSVARNKDYYMWRFVLNRPQFTVVPYAETQARIAEEALEDLNRKEILRLLRKGAAFITSLSTLYTTHLEKLGIAEASTQITPRLRTAERGGSSLPPVPTAEVTDSSRILLSSFISCLRVKPTSTSPSLARTLSPEEDQKDRMERIKKVIEDVPGHPLSVTSPAFMRKGSMVPKVREGVDVGRTRTTQLAMKSLVKWREAAAQQIRGRSFAVANNNEGGNDEVNDGQDGDKMTQRKRAISIRNIIIRSPRGARSPRTLLPEINARNKSADDLPPDPLLYTQSPDVDGATKLPATPTHIANEESPVPKEESPNVLSLAPITKTTRLTRSLSIKEAPTPKVLHRSKLITLLESQTRLQGEEASPQPDPPQPSTNRKMTSLKQVVREKKGVVDLARELESQFMHAQPSPRYDNSKSPR